MAVLFSCPGPGSNRHVFKGQWILSPSRLPIPPLGPVELWRGPPRPGEGPLTLWDVKGIEKSVIIKFGGREFPELNVFLCYEKNRRHSTFTFLCVPVLLPEGGAGGYAVGDLGGVV